MTNQEKFSLDCIGDTTELPWRGVFTTKVRLSHRDQLRMDELRRDLLGKNPEHATPRAQNSADVFSFILSHLIEAPQWWSMNANGLDLEDDNVIAQIYGKIVEIKVAAAEKLKSDGEAAKTELAKAGK